ncbi:MAG: hypothetical protein AMXMBFR64_25510 [Myxococcales bacterium]
MNQTRLVLYNAVALPIMYSATALYALVGGLSTLISPSGRLYMKTARAWSRMLLRMSGTTISSRGTDGVDWSRPFILMSNHQSHFDIPCLFATVPVDLRFLSKHVLAWIPIFGWSMWAAGFIFINRSDQKKAFASIDKAIRTVREGRSIVVFPEGTRSKDGALKDFKKGAFHMAAEAGVQIVPAWVEGSRHIMQKNSGLVRPGTHVDVRFGRPFLVDPREPDAKATIAARVRSELERLSTLG